MCSFCHHLSLRAKRGNLSYIVIPTEHREQYDNLLMPVPAGYKKPLIFIQNQRFFLTTFNYFFLVPLEAGLAEEVSLAVFLELLQAIVFAPLKS